jgi:hypothetical protein
VFDGSFEAIGGLKELWRSIVRTSQCVPAGRRVRSMIYQDEPPNTLRQDVAFFLEQPTTNVSSILMRASSSSSVLDTQMRMAIAS